jgi:ribonuclease BN (tRNA processing enzyme)
LTNRVCATPEQRLTCFLIDDRVAIDAGSIALALTDAQHESVRDVIVTHPHMDHMATLPIFIDDHFALLTEPVRVHATAEVIALLERDVFNWTVYPRFSQLKNDICPVMEYVPFRTHEEFQVAHLRITAVPVNHIVPTVGLVVSDGRRPSRLVPTRRRRRSSGKSSMRPRMSPRSSSNHHSRTRWESSRKSPAISRPKDLRRAAQNHAPDSRRAGRHLKPSYREAIVREIDALGISGLSAMQPGREYEW